MTFAGSDRFIVGANLPWVGYGTDIGASAWYPDGGLSAQPAALDLLERTFAALARDGVWMVRTFVLCDARSGVRFDPAGVPVGLDEAVFPDLDALVAAARRHGVRLMPVLLDFHFCEPPKVVNGVQLGGHAPVIADPGARSALIDLVIRPITERYRDEATVIAWDVMNEPEWCLGTDALQEFLGQAVACVRESASQAVTIGCAGIEGLNLVRTLGLDVYQVHWYEAFGRAALERPVSELNLNHRPIILGEFPGRSPAAIEILGSARRSGYAGAFVWSVLADDAQSAYPSDVVAWLRAPPIEG